MYLTDSLFFVYLSMYWICVELTKSQRNPNRNLNLNIYINRRHHLKKVGVVVSSAYLRPYEIMRPILLLLLLPACGEGQTEGATWFCYAAAGAHSALGARGSWRRD